MSNMADRLPVERRKDPSYAEDMAMIRTQMQFLCGEMDTLREWQNDHQASSAAMLEMQGDLKTLITGLRWVTLTVRIVTWIGASVLGVLLFLHSVWPYLSHGGKQQ